MKATESKRETGKLRRSPAGAWRCSRYSSHSLHVVVNLGVGIVMCQPASQAGHALDSEDRLRAVGRARSLGRLFVLGRGVCCLG